MQSKGYVCQIINVSAKSNGKYAGMRDKLINYNIIKFIHLNRIEKIYVGGGWVVLKLSPRINFAQTNLTHYTYLNMIIIRTQYLINLRHG
jgi:hypothetical protein